MKQATKFQPRSRGPLSLRNGNEAEVFMKISISIGRKMHHVQEKGSTSFKARMQIVKKQQCRQERAKNERK